MMTGVFTPYFNIFFKATFVKVVFGIFLLVMNKLMSIFILTKHLRYH